MTVRVIHRAGKRKCRLGKEKSPNKISSLPWAMLQLRRGGASGRAPALGEAGASPPAPPSPGTAARTRLTGTRHYKINPTFEMSFKNLKKKN